MKNQYFSTRFFYILRDHSFPTRLLPAPESHPGPSGQENSVWPPEICQWLRSLQAGLHVRRRRKFFGVGGVALARRRRKFWRFWTSKCDFLKGNRYLGGLISQNFLGFPPRGKKKHTPPTWGGEMLHISLWLKSMNFGSETLKITIFHFWNIMRALINLQSGWKKSTFLKMLAICWFWSTLASCGRRGEQKSNKWKSGSSP